MRISDWSSDVCSSDLAAIAQVDARSWDQADAGRLLPRESAHHALDAAASAKAKRAYPKQCGSREQLLGRRRAAQKGEMARHLDFDIGRRRDFAAIRHPNTPWMYQLRSPVMLSTPSPRRKSQKRSPLVVSTWK